MFQVSNRAGLSTVLHTHPFVIDTSAPDIGIVSDGHQMGSVKLPVDIYIHVYKNECYRIYKNICYIKTFSVNFSLYIHTH